MRNISALLVLLAALLVGAMPIRADSGGGIKWNPPGAWKAQPPRPMRAATYAVPAAPGDKEDGECIVSYFGPGQGGGVKENVDRWLGQFEEASARAAAKNAGKTINGLRVTTLDVSGTYSGAGGPMAASKVSKPGYRLLGAIVDGPQGPVFFKFTGPAKTVAANRAAFEAMLASLGR